MSNKTLAGGALLLVTGLLIFGRFSNNNTQSSSASVPQSASANSVLQNNNAPDFSITKLGGGAITLSEFKGKKPVMLDFWASWCPNCRRNMPNLNNLYKKYKDRVEVIGVNLQEEESNVQNFISAEGIDFPIALDPYGQAANAFGIRYTNVHVLIDKNGNLIRSIPGDVRESDFTSLIQ